MLTPSQKHRIGTAAKRAADEYVDEFGLEKLAVQGDWDSAAYSIHNPGWPDEAWPLYQESLKAEILRLQQELEKENETVEIGEGVYEAKDGTVVFAGPVVTNADRAEWARNALNAFAVQLNMQGEDFETQISDLLCDLMHLCDEGEIDWSTCVARAQDHYTEEVREEHPETVTETDIQARHHHGSNGTLTWNKVWDMADDSEAVEVYSSEDHRITWFDGSTSTFSDPTAAWNAIKEMEAQ